MQQTEELRACRACLSTHGELHELEEGLLEKFQQVTSLRHYRIDGIPKHICSSCRALLKKSYDFRIKCLDTDKIILQRARSLNCIRQAKGVRMMQGSLADVSVAFRGKTECDKDINHVDCHEVVVKEEHAEIDSFQNVDFVDEPVDWNNQVNSNDDSHKSNTSHHAHHDVNQLGTAFVPTTVIKTECNIKNEVLEISPKTEFDGGFTECVDSQEAFSEETIRNTQVDLLEKVKEDTNPIEIENAIDSKSKISTIMNVKTVATNESDSNHCKKPPLRTRKYSFGCDICGKMFKCKYNIRDHITIVHSVLRPYSCEQCGKAFKSLSTLNHHQRVHTVERHFSCDICSKMFKSNTEVQRHRRLVHSEVRPHACERCGKAFKSLGTLKDHERVHTVKRPFSCGICSKTFKSKAEVQRHTKQVHNQERPYPCEECGKTFMLPYKLKIHQQVHTGECSFVCDICSKMFRTKYEVQRHARQVHGIAGPYPCLQCDKTFTFESNLKSHQLEHTG